MITVKHHSTLASSHTHHAKNWQSRVAYHKTGKVDIVVTTDARHELFQWDSCLTNELKLKRVLIEYGQTKSLVGCVGLRYAIVH